MANKFRFIGPFLFVLPVIIDCINGFLQDKNGNSMIGILYRSIVVLWGAKFIFCNPYKKLIGSLIVAFLVSIVSLVFSDTLDFDVISSAVKILFPYFLLALLFNNSKKLPEDAVIKYAILNGVLIASVLIYCFIFKTGFSSYVEGSYGTKGFFIAMNDVNVSLLLANSIACWQYLTNHATRNLVCIIIISVSCCLTGSMAGLFGVGIIFTILFLCINIIRLSDCFTTKRQKITSIILVWFCLIPTITYIINIIQNDSYLAYKYEDIYMNIFENSGRAYLAKAAHDVFDSFSLKEFLFGQGSIFQTNIARKLYFAGKKGVEIDFYDLWGVFGIIVAILIYYLPMRKMIMCANSFKTNKSAFYLWGCIGLFLYFIHSIYGGHAYTSPMASTNMVVWVYLLSKHKLTYI